MRPWVSFSATNKQTCFRQCFFLQVLSKALLVHVYFKSPRGRLGHRVSQTALPGAAHNLGEAVMEGEEADVPGSGAGGWRYLEPRDGVWG
jgi:hypothetical protein